MESHVHSQVLGDRALVEGSCVALIGGGGKTTLMLALASHLQAQGRSVIVTTTTKIWPPPHFPLLLTDDQNADVHAICRPTGAVCIGRLLAPDGKVHGVSTSTVCGWTRQHHADVVLCEADGSAGRPLKVHGPGEPVIPPCATYVLSVASVSAIGKPVGPETIHRLGPFVDLASVRVGEPVGAEHVAAVLASTHRFSPPRSELIFVLNGVETREQLEDAMRVEAALRREGRHEPLRVTGFREVPAASGGTSAFRQ